jgi:hypothetical protein
MLTPLTPYSSKSQLGEVAILLCHALVCGEAYAREHGQILRLHFNEIANLIHHIVVGIYQQLYPNNRKMIFLEDCPTVSLFPAPIDVMGSAIANHAKYLTSTGFTVLVYLSAGSNNIPRVIP